MIKFDMEYDLTESGASEAEILAQKDTYYAHLFSEQDKGQCALSEALSSREKGHEAIEAEQKKQDRRFLLEGNYPSENEVNDILQRHHIEPEPTPYWEICVNRINSLLSAR